MGDGVSVAMICSAGPLRCPLTDWEARPLPPNMLLDREVQVGTQRHRRRSSGRPVRRFGEDQGAAPSEIWRSRIRSVVCQTFSSDAQGNAVTTSEWAPMTGPRWHAQPVPLSQIWSVSVVRSRSGLRSSCSSADASSGLMVTTLKSYQGLVTTTTVQRFRWMHDPRLPQSILSTTPHRACHPDDPPRRRPQS